MYLLIQADLEESKTQENRKLQSALEERQLQFQETKELLMKELEAAKRTVEQVPVVHEVPVIDHEMFCKLTAENEELKVRLLKLCMFILLLERPYLASGK